MAPNLFSVSSGFDPWAITLASRPAPISETMSIRSDLPEPITGDVKACIGAALKLRRLTIVSIAETRFLLRGKLLHFGKSRSPWVEIQAGYGIISRLDGDRSILAYDWDMCDAGKHGRRNLSWRFARILVIFPGGSTSTHDILLCTNFLKLAELHTSSIRALSSSSYIRLPTISPEFGLEFGVADTHDTSVSLVKSTICGDQCPFGFVYNPL